jgi:hypothetical protein
MDALANEADRDNPFFALPVGPIFYHRIPIELGGESKRDSSLLDIAIAFVRIEFDLQALIVYTKRSPVQSSISAEKQWRDRQVNFVGGEAAPALTLFHSPSRAGQ